MAEVRNILFIGDSVTAAHRSWLFPHGFGYVKNLCHLMPPQWKLINKGKNGDRIVDLDSRWNQDVLKEGPNVISVNVGINDTWRRFDKNDSTTQQEFSDIYEKILLRTFDRLPRSTIILCEPFLLSRRVEMSEWYGDFHGKIETIHLLAAKYTIPLIRFNEFLNMQVDVYGQDKLSKDGIHPTNLGHRLMSEFWLSNFRKLCQV